MEGLDTLLQYHPFFVRLSPEHLKTLAGCAKNVRFDPGEYLTREGDHADWFYVLRQGKVGVQINAGRRGTVTVQTLSEGEILGWSWLIPPHYWRFDARAIGATRAIALDGACLRGKIEEDKALGVELLRRFTGVMAQRLAATRVQLLDVYGGGGGAAAG